MRLPAYKRRRNAIAATVVIAIGMASCSEPKCHEDEVRVIVYEDVNDLIGVGTVGCVPADNLPVDGYRP